MFDLWAIRLTIVCVIIFILQIAIEPLTDALVLISAEILSRPWMLLTSAFAHGSLSHLLYNMFALALFGSILEKIIGSRRWLTLYFTAAIAAGLAALPLYPAALGASGAIFGLLGALAVLRPRMIVWVGGLPMPMIVAAAVWAALDLAGLFAPTGIASAAHLAGLGFGLAAGLLWRKEFAEAEFRRWEREWL